MAWSTPVTDRTLQDVTLGTEKAFINVVDLNRILENTDVVYDLFVSELGITLLYAPLSPLVKDRGYIPSKADLNAMLGNIENMRAWGRNYLWKYLQPDPGFVAIDHAWNDGKTAAAPDYTDANTWEHVLLSLYTILSDWTPPVVSGNLTLQSGSDLELIGSGYLELIG